jgi:cell division septal protein FtsQ
MSEDRPLLFPELGRSYKQIFIMQVIAFYVLAGIIAYNFGWMWAAIAWAAFTLKDCVILSVGVQQHRADEISRATQEKMASQQQGLQSYEGRLLSRDEMAPPPTMYRDPQEDLTEEL